MRSSFLVTLLFLAGLQAVAQNKKDLGPDVLYSVSDAYINKNNKILIGASGGLYASSDSGKTWQRPADFRSSVYLHPKFTQNSKQEYLYLFGSSAGAELYLSQDDGESWTRKSLFISGLLTDVAAYGDTLFLATYEKGLYVLKSDSNPVWIPVAIPQFENQQITHIAFEKNLVVISTGSNGFYISRDRGINWQQYDNHSQYEIRDIMIANNKIFISYPFSGLYVSGDQGTSWVPKNGGLSRTNIMDMYAEGNDLYVVTDGAGYFYQSTADEITDWTNISSPVLVNQVSDYVAVRGNIRLTGSRDSIYTSANGGVTWEQSIRGIRDIINVLSIQAARDGSLWAIDSFTGIYKKSPTDEIFSLVEKGSNLGTAALKGDSLAILSDYRVRMYNVITGAWGKTLNPVLYFLRDLEYAESGFFISTLTMGVHQYTGTQWHSFNTGLPDLGIKGFGKTGNTLFAGTEKGLFKTNTADAQWTNVSFATASTPGVIKMIVDNDIIVVNATDYNTYISTDTGQTWKTIDDIKNQFVYSMHIDGDSIYIGLYQTFVYSVDRGTTWQQNNLGDYFIDAIFIHSDKLYLGTTENGIKEITLMEDQTITFEVTDKQVGDHPFALTATTTSGLPVSWSSSDPSIISINGSGVAAVHQAGTVTIKALQPGNFFFKSAQAEKTIIVSDKPAIVTGVSEGSNLPFSIYPIPCQNVLYVSDDTTAGGDWSVITTDGRTMNIQYTPEASRVVLDLSQFPAGIYMLQYKTSKSVWRKKIMKE